MIYIFLLKEIVSKLSSLTKYISLPPFFKWMSGNATQARDFL